MTQEYSSLDDLITNLFNNGASELTVDRAAQEHNNKLGGQLTTTNVSDKVRYVFQNSVRSKEEKDLEHSFENEDFDKVAEIIKENDNFITLRENDQIYRYNGRFYEPYGEQNIRECTQRLVKKCKRKTTIEVIDWIRRSGTYRNSEELFDNRIISLENGILDPETFEIRPHAPKYYATSVLPIVYNPQVCNTKLWDHILTIIDPKDANLIMELIWVAITRNNPFKKMFVIKGPSGTQKSALADLIAMVIGEANVSREKPEVIFGKGARFGSHHFIGRRMNIAAEIGNLEEEHLENQKKYVGSEIITAERKNDNAEYKFDPTKFVFLYTTNKLGRLYAAIDDISVISRYQFLICRNIIPLEKQDGLWLDKFWSSPEDKVTAVSTLLNIIIRYKKAQRVGLAPRTAFATTDETKKILRESRDPEDRYFDDQRIIHKSGSKLTLNEIQSDFEKFVNYKIKPQEMGHILKKNGFFTRQSNGKTICDNIAFSLPHNQSILGEK